MGAEIVGTRSAPRATIRRKLGGLFGMLFLVALPACGDDAAPAGGGAGGDVAFAPQLGVDLESMEETGSGLYREDVTPGTGAVAESGNTVTVHYTGWLPDGTEFDSSRGGAPFQFGLGQGQVIPGWDEGVQGMQVGGVRRLVIPSELAYGDTGAGGVIPPGATLVFEVELLGVE